jgi:hypothetical protein
MAAAVGLEATISRAESDLDVDVRMPAMIKRTIKPAAGYSRVSPKEAKAAARLVYRDSKGGRFVILDDGELSDRRSGRAAKRIGERVYPRDAAKQSKGSSRRSSRPASAKKR